MADQEEITLFDKVLDLVEESTTFEEQITCFLCCFFFIEPFALSYSLISWSLYFTISLYSTLFRDDLDIDAAGWKEKSTFKKVWTVMEVIIVQVMYLANVMLNLIPFIVDDDVNAADTSNDNQSQEAAAGNEGFEDELVEEEDQGEDVVLAIARVDDADAGNDTDLAGDQLNLEKSEEGIAEVKKLYMEKQAGLVKNALNITDELCEGEACAREDQGEDGAQVMANARVDDADDGNDNDLAGDQVNLENLEDAIAEVKKRDLEKQADSVKNALNRTDELCEGEACAREDLLTEQLEKSRMKIEDLMTAVAQQRLEMDTQTARALHLEFLLAESRGLETSVMARNSKLYDQLSAYKAECKQLHASLVSAQESKQALEEQVEQLKASLESEKERAEKALSILEDDKSELIEDFQSMVSEAVEQHMLEKTKLIQAIEKLETENMELHARLSTADGQVEHFRAFSSEREEQHKLEKAKLNETIEELKSEQKKLCTRHAHADEHLGALVEQHKLEKAKLDETIEELKAENKELHASLSTADGNAEHFLARSLEREEQHNLEKAKLNKTIEDMKSELCESSLKYAESFRILSSKCEEQHKLETAKLKEAMDELMTENKELHARLSNAFDNVEHFRALSSKFEELLELEKDKLNKTISELENEKNKLVSNLALTSASFEHFRARSSEYEEAKEKLEEEKEILLSKLQMAKESAEFHQKVLHEYDFI